MTSPLGPPKPTPDCYRRTFVQTNTSDCLNGRKCGSVFLILTCSRNVCVFRTLSGGGRGHTFLCSHLQGAQRKSSSQASLLRGGCTTNLTLLQTELSPGPAHSGYGWESLENNPGERPLGQKDSNESQFCFKALHGGVGAPPSVREHGKCQHLPYSSKFEDFVGSHKKGERKLCKESSGTMQRIFWLQQRRIIT